MTIGRPSLGVMAAEESVKRSPELMVYTRNSWRLAVETNNMRNWNRIPAACEHYVGHYMLGHQYQKDCNVVSYVAIRYAKSLKLAKDGKDVWVFDIDETALSNLQFFARSEVGFGVRGNDTSIDEWIGEGMTPPLLPVLKLYKELFSLGFGIIFISGTPEKYRNVRISNLNSSGYHTWEKLILKAPSDSGTTPVEYKSNKRKEVVEEGYRIIGNIGDQWSDLLGTYSGNRTFKVPNPMYYVG